MARSIYRCDHCGRRYNHCDHCGTTINHFPRGTSHNHFPRGKGRNARGRKIDWIEGRTTGIEPAHSGFTIHRLNPLGHIRPQRWMFFFYCYLFCYFLFIILVFHFFLNLLKRI